ncbi:hypothetical protein VII00023_14266 [Vibrio ichthyoenteri ATCC 700023]|uniref:Type IV pilus assembly protein PilW n=1 Tax=Vibrio ichthyoenteri ATCC 700023 TaxID=870968 RepID=F9S2A3_9VIBR|nr:hypothetical protein [Vibrio ichthyoenteri]EGU39893.1 hypothetical protein VII00023_14266 [Vibrio ichthyoenteri ATCC 700023]
MAIRPVAKVWVVSSSRRVVGGFSAIELMLAATLGSLALALIGTIFISVQKVAWQKSQQLYLLQSMTHAFRTIEEDIQRAGFDNGLGKTLILSGATSVIARNGSSEFGLAYYREMVSNDNYRSIRYWLNNGRLMICEQGSQLEEGIKSLSQIHACRTLLDENVLNVASFSITSSPIGNSQAQSTLWHLTLSAHTLDMHHSRNLMVDVKQRNWQ